MFKLKDNHLYASEIARFLGTEYVNRDIPVSRPCHIDALAKGAFTYVRSGEADRLSDLDEVLVICPLSFPTGVNDRVTYILCDDPKLLFFKVVNEFFIEELAHRVDSSASIAGDVAIGLNVHVGSHSVLTGNVSVGNNTFIGNNVTIAGNVSIGANCVIKDGAVVGSEGFSFLKADDGLMHVPQIGEIEIGDEVWIGCNTCVERPSLGKTVLHDGVKCDDLVQIGHAVSVGRDTQIAAGTILAGRVGVGRGCFLGVHVSVKEGVRIGDDVVVGMGAVVTKDLAGNATYAGVPARRFQKEKAGA